MTKLSWGVLPPVILLTAVLLSGGCGTGKGDGTAGPKEGGKDGPGDPGTPSNVRQIMGKLGRGPQSLTNKIGGELASDDPPWDDIQLQAREYAELTAELGKYDPPRGARESWEKLTAEYAATAAALDRAVQAKDRDAARAAHTRLNSSCMACHKEHRGPPPGGGK